MGNLHNLGAELLDGSELEERLTSKAHSESSLANSTSASLVASGYGLQMERELLKGVVVLGELNPPVLYGAAVM
jgi:hypothetical protein